MILTPNQTQELLEIIDKNQVIALGRELGPDFLTLRDKQLLKRFGIDYNTIYQLSRDSIATAFHLGMLAESIGAQNMRGLTYNQLKDYIKGGNYIPLTIREKAALNSVKAQTFNDLKTLNSKIFRDVNQTLLNNSLKAQKDFLREEIAEGVKNKKTVRQIANEIAEKTGDWSRDFDRIVTYATTTAFEEGKAAMIEQYSAKSDPLVFKKPLPGACKHCIRVFLTDGEGSQPRIFKLSELRANGSNIGRKPNEWLATLGPVHPYCRCPLEEYREGSIWNNELQDFIMPERVAKEGDEVGPKKRKAIRIWVGGKEHWV